MCRIETQWFLLPLLLLIFAATTTDALYIKRHIDSTDDWKFLTKFCMAPADTYSADKPYAAWMVNKDGQKRRLCLYDDVGDSNFKDIYHKKHVSCEERSVPPRNKLKNSTAWIERHVARKEMFADSRPRFWYLAISNCDHELDDMDVEVEFLNPGSSYSKQFSWDKNGMLTICIVFFIFFVILWHIHIFSVFFAWRNRGYRLSLRFLTASLSFAVLGLGMQMVHYSIYAGNGQGSEGILALGEMCTCFSGLCFTILLMMMAKGWYITSDVLYGKKSLLVGLVLYATIVVLLFIWENAAVSPASTLYVYESGQGITICVLRVLMLFWFGFILLKTHIRESTLLRKVFYKIFVIVGILWFLSLPMFVIIAALLSAWVRLKIVTALSLSFDFIVMFVVTYIMWPSALNRFYKESSGECPSDSEPGEVAEPIVSRDEPTPYDEI